MHKGLLILVLNIILGHSTSFANHIIRGALTKKFQSVTSKVSYQLKLTMNLQNNCLSITEDRQVPNDSVLAAFYNQTITDFFSKTSQRVRKKDEKFKYKLIRINIDSTNLIRSNGKDKFKYYNKRSVRKVLSRPYKRNNGRDIYNISYKPFGADTIDILISTWTIVKMTKKTFKIHVGCGGTMGYIPEGRFVFNQTTKSWTFYSYDDIVDQKLREEEIFEEQIRLFKLKIQNEKKASDEK